MSKKESGQASFEYILLIAVVMTVAVAMFKKLEGYIASNPNSLLNTYLDSFEDMFGADHSGLNLRYKRFYIRK